MEALSNAINRLVSRIVSIDFTIKLEYSILNDIRMRLVTVYKGLDNAKENPIPIHLMRNWLHELKNVVYEVDNIVDEIEARALTHKIEAESKTFTGQVWNLLHTPFRSSFNMGMNDELKTLFLRLDLLVSIKCDFLSPKDVSQGVWIESTTTSVVDQPAVYGRDGDMNKLKEYLLSYVACDDRARVLTIVGMGGIGKTTVAQLLYNDQQVNKHFDLKAWVCMTKDSIVSTVTATLLESVSSKPVTNNFSAVQVELKQRLRGKKFLFVLDDVQDTRVWYGLLDILNSGRQGSRVIVTTRQEKVALAVHTFPIHYLMPLSSEDCWCLLANHAFGVKHSAKTPKLEMIGRKIADKCGGIPIAAVAIGNLLQTKFSENEWNTVLESNIWDLPEDNILPALQLSYCCLPAPLKECFAYCSIFPKGYKLDKETVVRLWMAEGLIQYNSYKSLEDTGNEYFDELVSSSLILRDSNYENMFKMHDLINDLATATMAGYCCRFEDPKLSPNLNKVRHLSYNRGKYDHHGKFDAIFGIKELRTFIALPLEKDEYQTDRNCYLAKSVLHALLLQMRCLRVLSLSHYDNIFELPNSLGDLIHLRYLDLSYTKIKRLPNGICKLYNLQTLLLSNCEHLIELPREIEKLINLRHIDLTGTKLKEMPRSMSLLKHLKTLTSFVVSKHKDGLKIKDLGNFLHLQGKLSILNLQNVVDAIDAFQANLQNKKQIDEIVFKWGPNAENSHFERVLEYLQPSTELKKLAIEFYSGISFSNWLGDSSFCNMVSLCLSDCNYCLLLPPLGQLPALKSLRIFRLKSLQIVGTEFYGGVSASYQPFLSLELLIFDEMPKWEEWLSMSDIATEFPSLRDLHVFRCPRLKGNLPYNLPSLITLRIFGCDLLELRSSNEADFRWTYGLQTLQVAQSPLVLSLLELRSMPFLNYFNIAGYHDSLQVFPRMISSSNYLQTLYIHSIPTLKSFQNDGLPTSLVHLGIFNCERLEFPPPKLLHNYSSLVQLILSDSCHSMECFPLDSFPVLVHLEIKHCTNLKSFSVSDNLAYKLSHLKTLYVRNCPNLSSFPRGGLSTFNLERLLLRKCEKLISLPERVDTLTSLQHLMVCELPCLESFAEEGLPSNLKKLEVFNCEKLSTKSVTQWGSQWLTSLTEITIGGDDLVNALMTGQLLPTSLVSLCIRDISYFDGKGLPHLTSLENLQFKSCFNLQFLPEMEFLNLPLSVLSISDCPLLQETYLSNGGINFPKIGHIPCIEINEEVIM
ncbi:putative disease resistance protein At3g14460 [Abrus precatorius]|uniref:Disease resistance protein At3g14460 n=1 Tax=Abrus precatorius TaxID=3816 RepID=A0A8B8K034_ABRPR|nr:putative disease resistance protein At3g14460 [Abrus precatorius]